ncbi:anaerobic sulfatase maturase [Chloroflexota bacterium]
MPVDSQAVSPSVASTPLPAFHVMLKPRGSICNFDCQYCYYLSKERLYEGSRFRMSETLLADYTRQYSAAQRVPEVTFAWQGGEPTLMGLDFFEQAIVLQRKTRKPGMRIQNALQTNGILLDDAWCRFFKKNDFLIGLSLDGPQGVHDHYRVDKGGQGTFAGVMRGLDLLKKHGVAFNILTTVHAANAPHPLEVYRFLRDEVGAQHIQFIPIIERDNDPGTQEGSAVTERSVSGPQYGEFLSAIFDEWVRHDVGRVFVQLFDVAFAAWLGEPPGLCVFEETCGHAMVMEHNGDVYSCDHFVEPRHKLGNMQIIPLAELASSEQQEKFGQDKRNRLPGYCRQCAVRFVCNGGCPKNRILHTPDGEPGLNILCAGYKTFFTHIKSALDFMVAAYRAEQPPASVMSHMAEQDAALARQFAQTGRNDPCPCGSGLKYKRCHGRR